MRLLLLLVGLAAAAEVRPGADSPQPSHPESATRNAPSAGGEASAPSSQRRYSDDAAATTAPPRQDFERKRASAAQVIRDKKEAEQVAKKLFKDRPGPPRKVKDARKAVKEESIKLTRGGGAPPIPKPPSGEPPSEEEARRRARRLMRRMSRKRKGKKHRKSKAFKKGML
jgi:hypothetical protein